MTDRAEPAPASRALHSAGAGALVLVALAYCGNGSSLTDVGTTRLQLRRRRLRAATFASRIVPTARSPCSTAKDGSVIDCLSPGTNGFVRIVHARAGARPRT